MEDQAARKLSIEPDDLEDTQKAPLLPTMLNAQTEKRQIVQKAPLLPAMLNAQTEKRQALRIRSSHSRLSGSAKKLSQSPDVPSTRTDERSEPAHPDALAIADSSDKINQSIRISLSIDVEQLPSLEAREIIHQDDQVDQVITQPIQAVTQTMKAVRIGVGRIVNNTVISLIGQAVTWTSTFLLIVAYGRFLGDVKFGELYTATNLVGLIGFPIELGFNQQIIRDVAVEPSKASRYFANTVLLKFALWFVLFGLTLLISLAIGYTREELFLVAICGLTLLISSVSNTFSSLYYAFERTLFPVIGSVLEKGLSALFGVILLAHGADVRVMAFVLLGGALVSCIWQAVCFFRIAGSRFIVDTSLIRALVITSIPFILYGVLGVIYYRIDTVILSVVTSAAVVGWYGAGYRLFDTLSFLPGIVIRTIMSPIFAKLTTASEEKLQVTIEKSTNFLLICGLPITVGLIVAAPSIISFLYHRSEFMPAVPSLQALAPGLIFLYMNTVFNTILVSTKKEKKITLMAGIALLFNLGLNCLLIPLYQHVGAAIVTSLTELLLLCLSIIFTPKHLLPKRSLYVGAKALVASVVMGLAVWSLSFLHIYSIFAIVPVAAVVYGVVALSIGVVPREDLQALYKLVRNKVGRGRRAA